MDWFAVNLRRKTDEEVFERMAGLYDEEGPAHYNGHELKAQALQRKIEACIAEMDRRFAQGALFEDRTGYHLSTEWMAVEA